MGSRGRGKILIIENSKYVTGAFRSMRNYCWQLKDIFEFHFLVPAGCWFTLPPEEFPHRYTCDFLEVSKSLSTLWYGPRLFWNFLKARRIVKQQGIEVIHVGDLYNMLGICLKLYYPRKKLIYHVRLQKSSYAGPLYHGWIWAIKRFADEIICVSDHVYKEVGAAPKSILIYDMLDEQWMQASENANQENKEIKLLYVANYIPGKGQNYALEVMSKATAKMDNLKLKFIGSTMGKKTNKEYLVVLKETSKSKGISHLVEFADFSEHIQQEMAKCQIVLNFSESESFSMICLEALACKTPIIATSCGGPEEIIRHCKNGLLVPNRNTEAMTEALLLLASNSELRKAFAKEGHIDFEDKFNRGRLMQLLTSSYSN